MGDDQTAAYASALVGKSLQSFFGGSTPPEEETWDAMMGRSKFTGSFNQHYEQVLQNTTFMHGRTGGAANDYQCDAIAVKSGEPFSNGENWLAMAFSQK